MTARQAIARSLAIIGQLVLWSAILLAFTFAILVAFTLMLASKAVDRPSMGPRR